MPTINMLSSAHKVKGQGVLSAYIEQVKLVETELSPYYRIVNNRFVPGAINHYHTIDLKFFLSLPFAKFFGKTVAYVHFVPDTIDDSLKLPPLIRRFFYAYMLRFYRSVDHIVVVNPYFIDVLKTLGISEEKVTYIPNYVSETRFYRQSPARIALLKQQFGLPKDKFIVLGVGQVQTRKGIMDFIETAKRLPHISFIWAGGFSFGAITEGYKELKKIVDNPPPNVMFTGIIDREDMNDLYNIADLMFLPSYSELFPMSILEALALKLPVLLRDLELYPAILFNHYMKGASVDAFVTAISTLQGKDGYYEYWRDQSRQCHEYYSEHRVALLWREFYDRIQLSEK
ncbi:glycosyltransferase family 4 protein [Paenibacillus albus]|uniref:Glycosyltransferase n=1 Tax=Paenibacillus albus TaxID=2495582 RepID=A0A3S9A5W2_9BACL|nr:glycosyltransferase family 4 protein [Paenibacillus albus]AZN41114.1 glycosyltransferase [Paenibacillus albus]